MNNTRLAGHGLVSEGAPHDHNGQRIYVSMFGGVSGEGHAKCTCGELSPRPIPSAYQRKQWHAQHKNDARTATASTTNPTATPESQENSP